MGLFGGLGAILVAVSLGSAAYFYIAYTRVMEDQAPWAELASLVAHISKYLELPAGEMPTLLTVTDQERLSGQDLFASSQNGDKVLLYHEARKVILYRPSTGKIVNVAVINASDPIGVESVPIKETKTVPEKSVPDSASEVTASEPAKVVFLNGSTKIGVTQGAEEKLVASFPDGVAVVGKEKASKNTYQGIIVADISGRVPTQASEIAAVLGGMVSVLPSEESISGEADIVVIIGNVTSDTVLETTLSSKAKPAVIEDIDIVPKTGVAVQQ
ncbi:MAG: hypothetical protein KA054_02685 [Candidatus Moranbacteria bacterium]|nr:hypothetical protein [Candidatus Moranbacteria bacterium]